jgi:D-3-phosphoglycerate dehydrogenase
LDKPELLVMGVLPDWDLEPLAERYILRLLYEAPDEAAFLAEHAANIRAIVTKGEIGASAALMERLPQLGLVACYGVGIDAIDKGWCAAHGIPVTNTPDVLTEDVADKAFALLLGVARQVPQADAWVRDGRWTREGSMPLTTRVWGKRIGIVGLGHIGRAVARRAEGFGMAISYSGRTPKDDVVYPWYPTPAALAPDVDILVCCAMGGPTTQGLIDRATFEALRPGSIFVNVSRGSCCDEAALLDAIRSGRIAMAGLDVFWNEPAIDPAFTEFPNVLLAPHAASGTVETRKAMGQLMRDNVEAYFAGRPLLTEVK